MFMSTTGGPVFAFVAICFAAIGFKAASALFWPIPQGYLDARIAAAVIALINSVGNLGGCSPTTFGLLEQTTGSIEGGLYGLAATSLVAAVVVFFARTAPRGTVPPASKSSTHPHALRFRSTGSRLLKIVHVTVTPIAFRDPPLLNASGIHEPFALRSIIEIESDTGYIGLRQSYGDARRWRSSSRYSHSSSRLDPFNLNQLRAIVQATVAAHKPASLAGAELAPGSHASKAVSNAYSAFEVAFLDLQAHSLNVPLVDLLGGAIRDQIPFSAYLFFKYATHIDSPYKPDSWGEALERGTDRRPGPAHDRHLRLQKHQAQGRCAATRARGVMHQGAEKGPSPACRCALTKRQLVPGNLDPHGRVARR